MATLPTTLGMPDRQRQGDRASHAVAEHVGPLDLQVFEQRGRVVRHLLAGQRAVDVRRVSVPLQLDGDLLPVPGQGRVRGRPAERPVQQDQRLAGAVDFVVHLQAVDRGVPLLHRSRCIGIGLTRLVARFSRRCHANRRRQDGEHRGY